MSSHNDGGLTSLEIVKICQSIKMTSEDVPVTLECQPVFVGVIIQMMATVTHRETGNPIPLSCSWFVPSDVCPDAETLIKQIYDKYVELWTHEAAETFYVNGARVFDPHAEVR